MNFKLLALILLTLTFIYKLFMSLRERKSFANPIPANVSDIYDETTYAKWRAYSAEKSKWEIVSTACSYILTFVLLITNAYAGFARLFNSDVYVQALSVVLLSVITDGVFGAVFGYIDAMIVEQKYGFNRTTIKTFIADQIKNVIISFIIMTGITFLLAALHMWLKDYLALAFALAMFVFVMLVSFLFPFFSKIFNKFTPLEDGELKDKLCALLTKNGYSVRKIQVMDASRRSSKSNAYFTGFGKTKTIVLYDTLVSSSTPDEICAVFAHEMGHGLHRDTLKNQILSFINIAVIALCAFFTVKYPAIYVDFGFDAVNYGFALLLVATIEMEIIAPLFSLFTSWRSRKAEYRADARAVSEGYGKELISALKKLAKENFAHLAPDELIVKLTYSHPTLSQRITAIEAGMKVESGREPDSEA
ncbi:MAG: M48 family metallopeptidase [Clostridia bacterium]|nr:M48 family metallopeptidase [Clostridia bacterium]